MRESQRIERSIAHDRASIPVALAIPPFSHCWTHNLAALKLPFVVPSLCSDQPSASQSTMQPALICPSYRSDNSMKNGTTWWGKQNYKGRECDRQFIEQHQWQHKEKNHHFLHWYDSGTSSGRKLAATRCEYVLCPCVSKTTSLQSKNTLVLKNWELSIPLNPTRYCCLAILLKSSNRHSGFWFYCFWHGRTDCCLISKCKYLLVIDRRWAT